MKESADVLLNWLSSLNPTKIAYGYLGLYILHKQGEKFTSIQLNLLKTFEDDKFGYNKNTYIETCSGCMYGAIYNLENVFKSDFFNGLIRNYCEEIR